MSLRTQGLRPEIDPLQLTEICSQSQGSPRITVAIIDGPIDWQHADLRHSKRQTIPSTHAGPKRTSSCQHISSPACQHGTFIAGLLAASRSAPSPGLCPQCQFISYPIFCEAAQIEQCPIVSIQELSQAIHQCLAQGAQLINLSLALAHNYTLEDLSPLHQAFQTAQQQGCLIVAAAGNHASRQGNPLYQHPWPIPVAAAQQRQAHPQTNLGGSITRQGILAPGTQITSLQAGGGTTQMTGSSVAAPFLTGTLALLWSLYPEAQATHIRQAIRPAQAILPTAPPFLNAQHIQNQLQQIMSQPTPTIEPAQASPDSEHNTDSPPPLVADKQDTPKPPPSKQEESPTASLTPQSCGCGGGETAPTFIYALGTIKPVFPNQGLRKEFDFAAEQIKAQPTDYFKVLNYRDSNNQQSYLYIAESMQWVLEIDNVDSYFLLPRSQFELQELINALEPQSDSLEALTALAVGLQGPSSPVTSNGQLTLPVVFLSQLFYFTYDKIISQISSSSNIEMTTVRDLLQQLQSKPNNGATSGGRALNYIAYRFPEIYQKADQLINPSSNKQSSYFLESIDTEPSSISGTRNIVDVIFKYQQFDTQEQQSYYCSVDITGQFPFLVTPLRIFVPKH